MDATVDFSVGLEAADITKDDPITCRANFNNRPAQSIDIPVILSSAEERLEGRINDEGWELPVEPWIG